MKNHIVVTTDYATGRIIVAYGPLTETEANNLALGGLPASSHRDHHVVMLNRPPAGDWNDRKEKRGK